MELEQRSDDAQVREYIEEIKTKLREAKEDIERLLGKFDSMPPNKQVAKSFPSIELTHFCVSMKHIVRNGRHVDSQQETE